MKFSGMLRGADNIVVATHQNVEKHGVMYMARSILWRIRNICKTHAFHGGLMAVIRATANLVLSACLYFHVQFKFKDWNIVYLCLLTLQRQIIMNTANGHTDYLV